MVSVSQAWRGKTRRARKAVREISSLCKSSISELYLGNIAALDVRIKLFQQVAAMLCSKATQMLLFQKEVDSQVGFRDYGRV